jgi:hypothetical protein
MSKAYPIALLAGLASLLVLANGARAGVTIDVHFQDQTSPTGITINANNPASHVGPGCSFGGYYNNTVSTGYCMDVMLYQDTPGIGAAYSVAYDSDNGLAVASFYEWLGVGVSFDKGGTALKSCVPFDGVTDDGSEVGTFDCGVPPPNAPPSMAPGTYRMGTIVWDTSGTTVGTEGINILVVGATAVINGNIILLTSEVVTGNHIVNIIPEPGTAVLLGLGFVGLTLAARRRGASERGL